MPLRPSQSIKVPLHWQNLLNEPKVLHPFTAALFFLTEMHFHHCAMKSFLGNRLCFTIVVKATTKQLCSRLFRSQTLLWNSEILNVLKSTLDNGKIFVGKLVFGNSSRNRCCSVPLSNFCCQCRKLSIITFLISFQPISFDCSKISKVVIEHPLMSSTAAVVASNKAFHARHVFGKISLGLITFRNARR